MQLFVKGLPFQQVFTTLQFVKLGAAQVFVDLPQLALGVGKLADRRINLFPAEALAGFEPMPPGDQVECSLVATVLTLAIPGLTEIGVRNPSSEMLLIRSATAFSLSERSRLPTRISVIATSIGQTFGRSAAQPTPRLMRRWRRSRSSSCDFAGE